jgi:hypothetical protein
MKGKEQDHARDLLEIRAMMERSSKFVWLSGWAGIIAGFFALAGTYIAYAVFDFNPDAIDYRPADGMQNIILLGIAIWVLAAASAVLLSYNQARHRGERLWNATSRRLLMNIAVPFCAGAILIVILIAKGMIGLIAPFSLIFYGLALHNASKYTYGEVRIMGIIQVILGLIGSYFVEYGLWLWALGFGVVHIIYGIYIHFKYNK